jgi:hypothetical protein
MAQRTLEIDEKALGSEHLGVALDLRLLALIYQQTGDTSVPLTY